MTSDMDLSNWMSNLPKHLTERSLIEIAIPGSHDSFSHNLDPTSEIAPDESAILKLFGSFCVGPVNKVLYNWGVTQTLNIYQQLEAGIRYFDFRVATRAESTDIFFVHGLYGDPVDKELRSINRFLDEHKKEVVLLDFNHFYEMTQISHDKLISTITEVFGSKLCLYVGVENLTLEMMWENNLQVVVFYQEKALEESTSFWPSCSIKAPWPQTTDPHEVIRYLDCNYQQDRGAGFHVCQGLPTPDTSFVLGHLGGNLKTELSDVVMPKLLCWLQGKMAGSRGVNICMADFVNEEFTKCVIKLNYC